MSASSQKDIKNGGKNLAVVQSEQHVSVPIGCNEKSGAAPKVVRLFQKISAGTGVPFAFQPVELEILPRYRAVRSHEIASACAN